LVAPLFRENILIILFWLCASLIFFIYVVYLPLVYLLGRLFPRRCLTADTCLPSISLVISAFNEEDVIEEKLVNTLRIDYPRDRFETIVVSDCSDDRTDEIVGRFESSGVRLIRQSQRSGKSSGLNLALPVATGEIVIFSDANALYEPDSLRRLVRHFIDPIVGYVVGNARYAERGELASSAVSEGLYWKLETWMKESESRFGSVVGGDGAIYAIRRELYTPLRPTDINDLLNPLQIIAKGFRGVYEPYAICYEDASNSFDKEFRRKVRIVSRSLNAVFRAPAVLLPWTQPRHWFCLLSHKVLRWVGPFFLVGAFVSSLLLWHSEAYKFAAIIQLTFYASALIGLLVGRRRDASRILYIPYYFCLVNWAALQGIFKFLFGSLSPTWQTVRQGPGSVGRHALKSKANIKSR
jgi:cellulose synthase/poly-beta-1,6-N-acetylglucosamine synthase-like glycosyltransferase